MPRKKQGENPSYRRHRASGQAVVTLNGTDVYLGPHGTEASKRAYDRVISEWLANGRQLPGTGLLVKQLIARYWDFAQRHYRKHGKPTSQAALVHRTLGPVRRLYGETPVKDFGPRCLKAVRQVWVAEGHVRSTCNDNARRVKRMFNWGVAEELVPPEVAYALSKVPDLAPGRTEAKDNDPVGPVPQEHIDAILPHVRPQVATMIQVQALTGMRPGEVVLMRACDIDRARDVWEYRPHAHKTEHKGKSRIVMIGPKAQALLSPWIERFPEGYLFRPLALSTIPRVARRRKGKHRPGERYTAQGYGRRILAACRRHKVPDWAPNQLRHGLATEVRKRFGIEAVATVLGHSNVQTSEIYAERDLGKAADVARELG